jgi:hypothetical protein
MVQAAMKQCWHRLLFSAEPFCGSQLLGACSHKATTERFPPRIDEFLEEVIDATHRRVIAHSHTLSSSSLFSPE